MLLSEIKEVIKKYEVNELRAIIAEIYKSIPKKIREDKDIDSIIMDFNSHTTTSKTEKKSHE